MSPKIIQGSADVHIGGNEAREMSEMSEPLPLAAKITRLFDTIRNDDGRRYSDEDVARSIVSSGAPSISANYIYLLRTGKRDNPTKRHLEALAAFFDVSPAYFFDVELARQIDRELELLSALRNRGVRDVALRAAEMEPRRLKLMLEIMRELGQDDIGPMPPQT